jgi:hypothetical protein
MTFKFEDSAELQEFLASASDEDLLQLAKEHLTCISDEFCEFETYLWDEEDFYEFIPLLVITEGRNISKESLLYLRDNLNSGSDGERYARIMDALWMAHPDYDFNEPIVPYTREQAYQFTLDAPNRAFLEIVYKTYSHEEIVESAQYDAEHERNYVDQKDLQKYDEIIAAKMKL